ncbi:hypothetical protein ACOZ38_13025 [Sphaerisporangium viridialbum]|uniref:hypothetical protein n=1 Tax=Sphaerisporangium viridialbum TaxID=46189 RepID=UPI003C7161B6
MLLNLVFETPAEHARHVQETAPLTFHLYERDGDYLLPGAVLTTVPGMPQVEVQEVRVVPDDDGRRDHELAAMWNHAASQSRGWVVSRKVLAEGLRLPVSRVASGPSSPEWPVRASVKWRYTFTDTSGVAAYDERPVRVLFAAPGTPPPPPPGPPLDPEWQDVPFPIRELKEPYYQGVAAVDFGTSSATVTILDSRRPQRLPLDPQQARQLRERLAGLLRDSPPEHLAGQWRDLLAKLVASVAETLGERAPRDLTALAAELRQAVAVGRDPDTLTDALLDTVCLALDECLVESGEKLAAWLAPRLLDAYDSAFLVPNLFELSLRQVELDPGKRRPEILPSTVEIVDPSPVRIALGVDGPEVRRGLKSDLIKPELLGDGITGRGGRGATTDDLIAAVYAELIERTEVFARPDGEEDPPAMLTSVVVTYPTTTPPGARERLQRLIRKTLDMPQVITSFDEGVAAGLFFLMRDFGTDRGELGTEALISRSRRIGDDPPTWRQNMLVIDVGAGTTDIAVIRLTVIDHTRAIENVDPLVQGRYYVIRPEVVNSTGHLQLGGDYLTLRVFYWLKAAVLDALINGDGFETERRALAQKIAGRGQESGRSALAKLVAMSDASLPAPREIADVLRDALPTHWAKDAKSPQKQAFHLLWKLAEQTKIEMGRWTEETYPVPLDDVQSVLNAIDQDNAGAQTRLVDLLPKESVALDLGEFTRLARQILSQAVGMGRWLVEESFPKSSDERLDRVMLSGQTSTMPLMREVVIDELPGNEGNDEQERLLTWNPAAVIVEADYAKAAASLGACWAQSVYLRNMGLTGAEAELARGRTHVQIAVDNLFYTLPCAFQLQGYGRNTIPLLAAGHPMREVDAEGTIAARDTTWQPLLPLHEVHRPIGKAETIQWGVFNFGTRQEEGFRPDPKVFLPSSDGLQESRIKTLFEVDQNLIPYLYLCQGEAHYHVSADEGEFVDLRSELDPRTWDDHERRLRELPAPLMVSVVEEDGTEVETREIFPAWSPDGQKVSAYFDRFFHENDALDSGYVLGRVSAPLPSPPQSGYYQFFLRRPDGNRDELAPLRAPGPVEPTARYVATLDVRGRLRLHRGEPPFWKAESLRDVERHSGSVYKVTMDRGVSELEPDRDPFTGRH